MMMMMIGDVPRSNPPTLHIPRIPTWRDNSHNTYSCLNNYAEDPLITAAHIIHSPSTTTTSTSQCLYYDSGDNDVEEYSSSSDDNNYDVAMDAFSSDEFRMYEFKVKRCARGRSHDWTECPFVHPREKARRRDPRKYHYPGTACPDFRKGACRRGDACEHAHGVFECWLHPARYRTEPCKDGTHCRRRICFFAHTPDQLRRVLPSDAAASSSTPGTGSPPISPGGMLTESMRSLQLINNKMKMGLGTGLSMSPPSPSFWGFGVGSPRSPIGAPAFRSLPSTPMRSSGGRITNISSSSSSPWEYSTIISSCCEEEEEEEEPVMERVESGRELRERIYEKLGKDNSLDRATGDQLNHRSASDADPDFGWVSELVA